MTDLVDFIRGRLDEDEATAKDALNDVVPFHMAIQRLYQGGWHSERSANHLAHHDPARVLAQVAAMRRILARLEYRLSMQPDEVTQPGEWDDITRHLYEVAIDLTSVWSSHPDYDPAWSPDA